MNDGCELGDSDGINEGLSEGANVGGGGGWGANVLIHASLKFVAVK